MQKKPACLTFQGVSVDDAVDPSKAVTVENPNYKIAPSCCTPSKNEKLPYVTGSSEEVKGVFFAKVGGRTFEVAGWMTTEETLRNISLEVPCEACNSFFLPCTSIEFTYVVTPIAMSQVAGIRAIAAGIREL